MKKIIDKNKKLGFTIIELLVVIVVIGILAVITIVSYSDVTKRATIASLKTDLDNNADILDLYYYDNHGTYPSTLDANNCPSAPTADTDKCLKVSSGNTVSYNGGGQKYTLIETDKSGAVSYQTNENGDISQTVSFVNGWGSTSSEYAYSLALKSDGGYTVVGETNSFGAGLIDAFIADYDSNGLLLSSKTWGGTGNDRAISVSRTSDGGYVIAGDTTSFGSGGTDAFIAKYSSDGTLSWSKTWGGTGSDFAKSIIQTSDGGYAIAGWTNSYGAGNADAFIAKYTSDGTLSWSKTWGGTNYDYAYSIAQTDDGGYIITGDNTSFTTGSNDTFIAKYTSDGTLSWSKTWGIVGAMDQAFSVIETNDGGYVTAGTYLSDAFIAKFLSDGTLSWSKTWGGAGLDQAQSVIQTSDGGYLMAGKTKSYGAGNYDAFIAKYTSDGTLSWSKTWGGVNDDYPNQAVQSSDGGYAIAGFTASFNTMSNNMFIAKYLANGSISNCASPMCQNINASTTIPTAVSISRVATSSSPSAGVSSPSATTTSPNATVTVIVAR